MSALEFKLHGNGVWEGRSEGHSSPKESFFVCTFPFSRLSLGFELLDVAIDVTSSCFWPIGQFGASSESGWVMRSFPHLGCDSGKSELATPP